MTRLERLRKLAEEHVEPGPNTGAEDIAEYLPEGFGPYRRDGDGSVCRPKRWAAVTRAGDLGYVYPAYDTAEDAQDRAVAYVGDDIYAEYPVCVVDLDTGRVLVPERTVNWKEAP